jgi:hypothetical protein
MKIMRLAADELLVREWPDFLRLNQHDIVGVLHRSFDDEKGLFRNQEAHSLE